MPAPVWVILPTYNEAQNLETVVTSVLAAVPDVRVLVVDDPADLPRLLAPLADGADLVLGSRYVPGGGILDWDALRRGLSRFGCEYARRVLGVGIRDLTGGFKAFRADTLEAIDYGSVRSQGYAFQVELTWRALRQGLRVEEVPIVFRERVQGDSKMSALIALEAAWLVPALRFGRRRWEAAREPADVPAA